MLFADVAVETPTSVGQWVAVGSGIALIVSLAGGVIVSLIRSHVGAVVKDEVHEFVPKAVDRALSTVNVKLDGIITKQDDLSADVAVVRRLEAKIENGLSTKVNAIDERQRQSDQLLNEMHGWLQAQQEWDRHERRTSP